MTVKVWTPRIDRLTIRCLSVLSLLFISCSEEPLGGATSEDLTAARSADSVSVAEPLIASECTEYYNDYNATYKLDFGNCVECRLLEPEKALDGDPSTFATAILGIIDGPIRITVTPQSGVVFPSNTAPGVWTFIRLWAETSHNLDRDIDLFLDGSVKQFLDGRYQGPWQASWDNNVIRAGVFFDEYQLAIDLGMRAHLASIRIYEFCADTSQPVYQDAP